MEEMKEIDGKQLLKDILKYAWVIVLCALVFAVAALLYAKNFVQPSYKATATLYVNNNASSNPDKDPNDPMQDDVEEDKTVVSSNLAVALQLAKSYVVAIQKESVLETVVEQGEMENITAADIRRMMTAEVIEDTEIFQVSIVCGDPELAADIANNIARYAPKKIKTIIGGSSAEVVDWAKVPGGRFAPNYTVSTLLGGIAGALVSTLVITMLLIFDSRIHGEEDLMRICSIPVLGAIPDFTEAAARSEYVARKQQNERRKV